MSARRIGINPDLQVNRYSKAVPRPRKLWLVAIGASCLVNLVVVVVVLVRPTPQFNQSVLFKLRSAEAASLVRRSAPALEPYDEPGPSITPAPDWRPGLRKRSDYWISQGWNVECKVQTDWYICRVWDPARGTWSTQESSLPITPSGTLTATDEDSPATITSLETSPSTTSASLSRTSPTRTRSTARPTQTGNAGNDTIPGVFVGLWVGPMGACLDKRDAFRICSSPSFTPDVSDIYAQSGLSTRVTELLPKGTSGGTVMLLFSLIAYCVAVVVFTLAYKPATRARTRDGNRSYSNAGYIWLLAIATFANAIGVVTVLIATVVFNRVFANALNNIPDLPFELFAEAGGATTPLYATIAFGIISTAVGLFIVIDDLRLVLREAMIARARRSAKELERQKRRERSARKGASRRRRRSSSAAAHGPRDAFRPGQSSGEDSGPDELPEPDIAPVPNRLRSRSRGRSIGADAHLPEALSTYESRDEAILPGRYARRRAESLAERAARAVSEVLPSDLRLPPAASKVKDSIKRLWR